MDVRIPTPGDFLRKNVGRDEYIESVECNVCKLKRFGESMAGRLNIPKYELRGFLSELEELEAEYRDAWNENSCAMGIKHKFLKIIDTRKHGEYLTLDSIRKHLATCTWVGAKNRCLENISIFDRHIRVGLTEGMSYKEDENGEMCFKKDNLQCLKLLMDMKRQEINNYKAFGGKL